MLVANKSELNNNHETSVFDNYFGNEVGVIAKLGLGYQTQWLVSDTATYTDTLEEAIAWLEQASHDELVWEEV